MQRVGTKKLTEMPLELDDAARKRIKQLTSLDQTIYDAAVSHFKAKKKQFLQAEIESEVAALRKVNDAISFLCNGSNKHRCKELTETCKPLFWDGNDIRHFIQAPDSVSDEVRAQLQKLNHLINEVRCTK